MALYPWLNDAYTCNPYFDPPPGYYKDPFEEYIDGYWPISSINSTSVNDLRGVGEKNEGQFQVHVDVQQFKPEEISVKVEELGDKKSVTIEGKHEEKLDEHGTIFRHFVRRYTLPENCDANRVQTELSSDGVLTLIAPGIEEGKQVDHLRRIPIMKTGSLKLGEHHKRRMSRMNKNKCHIL